MEIRQSLGQYFEFERGLQKRGDSTLPKIALILGNNAYTDEDVYQAHKSIFNDYVLEEISVNLTNVTEIIGKLKEIDNKTDNNKFDVIALFRGGETSLDIFDDLNLAKTVLGLHVMHPVNQAARLRVACCFSKCSCSKLFDVLYPKAECK